jgi:hypothetical protein
VVKADMVMAKAPSMGTFERYLTLWVAICIVAGVALGQLVPGLFRALGAATVAQVNLPVAALVWLMIVPMLLKIDLAALGQVREHWRGIAVTVGVNWPGQAIFDGAARLAVCRLPVPALVAVARRCCRPLIQHSALWSGRNWSRTACAF